VRNPDTWMSANGVCSCMDEASTITSTFRRSNLYLCTACDRYLHHPEILSWYTNLFTMALTNRCTDVSIIDIRRGGLDFSLVDDIKTKLNPRDGGEKLLPTLLLYDERGLKLFEEITYLDEYYLTNAEIEVLTNYAGEIANRARTGTTVVELGSGYA